MEEIGVRERRVKRGFWGERRFADIRIFLKVKLLMGFLSFIFNIFVFISVFRSWLFLDLIILFVLLYLVV